jgi:hypothetical protein
MKRGFPLVALFLAAPHPTRAQAQEASPTPTVPVLGKWSASLYGFVDFDAVNDSTESFADQAGNTAIATGSSYAGNNTRLMMSLQNTRLGLKFSSPDYHGIRVSAQIEIDLLGNQPSNVTEGAFFTNPTFRLRHAYLKAENPIADVLVGQYWGLFGWQTYFLPNTVEIQGVPGEVYVRNPQIRLSKTFKTEPVNVEVAVAALRPAQRDSGAPDGEAGFRVLVNGWKGLHTMAATTTSVDALAVGVSGLVRKFRMQKTPAGPTSDASIVGWGYSIDLLIPVIPATMTDRANGLTLTGSFVRGDGIADQYTGLTGGFVSPSPFGGTSPTVDPGLIVQDSSGNPHAIQWRSFILGLQYYLPTPLDAFWISGNYSQMDSYNAVALAAATGSSNPANKVFQQSRWADFNLFWDLTPAVRLGLEYARFQQTYANNQTLFNNRWQVSAFYIF